MFWANAPGLIISVWLNLSAAKLQYCDLLATNMRSSFVQLLDRNRNSFMIPEGERGVLGGDLEDDEEEAVAEEGGLPEDGQHEKAKSFAHLRRQSLKVSSQNKQVPAPHEKVVLGGKNTFPPT